MATYSNSEDADSSSSSKASLPGAGRIIKKVSVTGLKITYSKKPLIIPDQYKTLHKEEKEWILRPSWRDTTLFTVLSLDPEAATHEDVKCRVDETRSFSRCIYSGRFALPVPPPEPSEESEDSSLTFYSELSGYSDSDSEDSTYDEEEEETSTNKDQRSFWRDLAHAQFYIGKLKYAWKNLISFHETTPEDDFCMSSAILELEIEAFLQRKKSGILRKLQSIETALQQNESDMPQLRLLLRLALEMRFNRRFNGAILALRMACFSYHQLHPDESCSVFRFTYTMVMEMSMRTLDAQKFINKRYGEWDENKLVIRCICDVVGRMEEIQKHFTADPDGRIAASEPARMVAECRNAIAFCCNSIGMYETADKEGAAKGMQKIEGFPNERELLRKYKVYPDLMVNKGISLLGRGLSRQAKYFFQMAMQHYRLAEDMTGAEDLNERYQRARLNYQAADKLLKAKN